MVRKKVVIHENAQVHEKKLLKKVKFLEWKRERYNIGVIPSRKSLALCDHLSVSSFCQLSTVLVRLKFGEHLKEVITYIEQGHIRVGPDIVTNPTILVTRNMEDFVTWVDSSKIKRKVLEYNEKLDDYDAMN